MEGPQAASMKIRIPRRLCESETDAMLERRDAGSGVTVQPRLDHGLGFDAVRSCGSESQARLFGQRICHSENRLWII